MSTYDELTGLEVLTGEECRTLLAATRLGRVAFRVEDAVEVFPVNYVFHGEAIVLRTAADSLLAAYVPDRRVAFEIDHGDPMFHTGWSVLVQGVGETIDLAAEPEIEHVGVRSWRSGRGDRWLRIRLDEVSGRRIVHRGGDEI